MLSSSRHQKFTPFFSQQQQQQQNSGTLKPSRPHQSHRPSRPHQSHRPPKKMPQKSKGHHPHRSTTRSFAKSKQPNASVFTLHSGQINKNKVAFDQNRHRVQHQQHQQNHSSVKNTQTTQFHKPAHENKMKIQATMAVPPHNQNQSSFEKRQSSRRVGTHVLKTDPVDTTHGSQIESLHETDIDYSRFEKPSSVFREKAPPQLQYEVSSSRAPNLNLSTYGYSVNASESTRRKAIQDAMRSEGYHAVTVRLLYLIKKYKSEETILDILSGDYGWAEDMGKQSEQREQRDRERNKSRMRIYQRMQGKSKHRKEHEHDHRY